ncbi:hypothetical protein MtrunA17_Chr2g0308911 [Medicago truncatula]|uniref:Uncharacterized protein n=1 Tax=Medicago truncatula TaxID=3880 RepID=A0A396JAI8_MEDTR|nr:hypothetical protein MtrunA17_Chr2g0308911 [Medicago truncatula]
MQLNKEQEITVKVVFHHAYFSCFPRSTLKRLKNIAFFESIDSLTL